MKVAGRIGVVVAIGILLVGVTTLAGTKTFTNDTGAVATGIKIEFSTNATITWHSGEFTVQDPTGFGTEFKFSGGAVQPDGTFTISWGPSAVNIEGYEWITEQSASASAPSEQKESTASSQGGALLYGNAYPGPDEPLYQPKPDEEIWLTDLEGHKDVYDNDGIRINFAPGFDRSTIEKIEWYRNGIHLPFLDDKLEITNAEMKTFKGDETVEAGMRTGRGPIQVTPPSSHTDHAIVGYVYGVAIFPKGYDGSFNWVAAKKTLTITVKSAFKWHPKEAWAEIDGAWMVTMHKLSYDDVVNYFKILKADGFTGISLDMPYYMMTPYDNKVFELKTSDPRISQWNMKTPSLSEVEEILKAISAAGLDVHVRGYIRISKQYLDKHGQFICSSFIDPTNPREFFGNYANLWLKLIPLLNQYHVKLITPFVEMESIEKYSGLIKEMYTKISEQFDGEMGFDEATNLLLDGHSAINDTPIHTESAFARLVRNFTFWDWKDAHGRPMRIEYSCWAPPIETQKDQRVSVMLPNFTRFWEPAMAYYNATYPQDPKMFGEIGVFDIDRVCMGFPLPTTNKRFDDQEMADIWYVYLKEAKELGINSLNIWQFPLGDYWSVWSSGNQFINLGIKQWPEMPAYRVITAIIGPED